VEVRLLDLDSKMANIAMMKISAFHKSQGDNIEWFNALTDRQIDKLYISKLFKFSEDIEYFPDCEIIKGGTGYDIHARLPEYIEKQLDLDYSIYPECDYTMQFFSRGCTRSCPFCVVKDKEGNIHPVEPMSLNPNGKHIEVLDNNFFANPLWKDAAEDLLRIGQPVNFHGIDIRTMNEECAYYLNKIKRHKQIHIAWDNPKHNIVPKLQEVIKYLKPYKLMCYVLIGYWSTPEEDLYRVEKLRELKIDPFVMTYDKSDRYQKDFARWVNHKAIFRTVKWEDYKKH
jgi:hypothetical protein